MISVIGVIMWFKNLQDFFGTVIGVIGVIKWFNNFQDFFGPRDWRDWRDYVISTWSGFISGSVISVIVWFK